MRGGPNTLSNSQLQALENGVSVAFTCLQHPELVSGGGSAEVALNCAVRKHTQENCTGLEARVMEAWADALLSIVITLAENAGARAAELQVQSS